MYVALLDSCVLWPSTLRDFLLSLSFEGAYRFVMSDAILGEVEVNEERKYIKKGFDKAEASQRAHHLITRMRESFPDSLVVGWEGLEGTFGLPAPNDEHVLAAALVGGAASIVTDNLRDFPAGKIPSHIQVQTAQEFCYETVEMNPNAALTAVLEMADRTGRKAVRLSPEEILGYLDSQYSLQETTKMIRPLLNRRNSVP